MTAPLAQEIRNAHAAAESILGELLARAFAYTVEQKDGRWTLRVECATDGGWQVTTLPVNPAELAASLRDSGVREKLSAAWRPHLQACAARSAESS
ncbi:MAG: hypothetical protein M0015_01060 [Betaproteobacteria bacterium]|nr:hypothetical protein [Betaproteobacteria bacterium]